MGTFLGHFSRPSHPMRRYLCGAVIDSAPQDKVSYPFQEWHSSCVTDHPATPANPHLPNPFPQRACKLPCCTFFYHGSPSNFSLALPLCARIGRVRGCSGAPSACPFCSHFRVGLLICSYLAHATPKDVTYPSLGQWGRFNGHTTAHARARARTHTHARPPACTHAPAHAHTHTHTAPYKFESTGSPSLPPKALSSAIYISLTRIPLPRPKQAFFVPRDIGDGLSLDWVGLDWVGFSKTCVL